MKENKNLNEQILDKKFEILNLYSKIRVQEALEKTNESVFEDLYYFYNKSFNLWGGVELIYWLEAIAKKFKAYNPNFERILMFPLVKKTLNTNMKLKFLKYYAKQMGLDVNIELKKNK